MSSAATWAMAIACDEFTLPIRKLTLSLWISLRAFCTATSVLSEVEILDDQADLPAENAALRIDLRDRQLHAGLFILAERRVNAGERIIHPDLDRFLARVP